MPISCPRCETWTVQTSEGNPYCVRCDQVWHSDGSGGLIEAPASPLRVTVELERQLAEQGVFKQTVQVLPDGTLSEVDEVVH